VDLIVSASAPASTITGVRRVVFEESPQCFAEGSAVSRTRPLFLSGGLCVPEQTRPSAPGSSLPVDPQPKIYDEVIPPEGSYGPGPVSKQG